MSTAKQISVRMPLRILERLEAHGPVAPYVIEAVKEKLDRDEEADIKARLRCLAYDDEANDISDWAPEQRKVMDQLD